VAPEAVLENDEVGILAIVNRARRSVLSIERDAAVPLDDANDICLGAFPHE
jgi:hypothetical protein